MTYRGRFAPSPTGPLHFGSLVTALGSYLSARSASGAWVVRIEDLDPPREVPGAAKGILKTLAAFGMASDEPVIYQSERLDFYASALSRLKSDGCAYICRCSRSDLAADHGLHRGPCRPASRTRGSAAWRLRVPDATISFCDLIQGEQSQDLARDVGDFVLRRSEGYFAYQLAVVVDDAEQDISQIVRGADLLDSTPRQIHLQRLLSYRTTSYAHLPLVVDEQGSKLSKQRRALPVEAADPLCALREALDFLGISQQHLPQGNSAKALLDAATKCFDLRRVPRRVSGRLPQSIALAGY